MFDTPSFSWLQQPDAPSLPATFHFIHRLLTSYGSYSYIVLMIAVVVIPFFYLHGQAYLGS